MTAVGTDRFALHLVTDERVAFDRLRVVVDDAVGAGVDVVQLRDKSASARELLRRAVDLADVIRRRCVFLINDRVDVALAARDRGAHVDGVHLGQSDLPPATARRLLGDDAIVGWTANTREHLAAAAREGTALDYLGVGVIRPTSTKPDHPPALGVAGFAALAAATDLPCLAIGGVTAADVPALRAAGAAGVAVVSAVCAADDAAQAVAELRAASAADARSARRDEEDAR